MSAMSNVTLDRIRKRDPAMLESLVGRHQRRLRGFIAILGLDTAAVDDVAQEVFLRAFRCLDRVEDLELFERFLRGIARNVVKEHFRDRGRTPKSLEPYIDQLSALSVTDTRNEADRMTGLQRCLEGLTPRSRRMLDLKYLEERPSISIAVELGMTHGSVRVQLLRIREALVRCLRAGVALKTRGAQP
jgi:RNA polymerase sigma-70 factor (ECF subfamily)